MTADRRIARRKLSLRELAQDLGDVSKACRIVGCSRQRFHGIRRNYQAFGAGGLLDKLKGPTGPRPNRPAPETEQAILDYALEHPTHGPNRVAQVLVLRGLQVGAGGVRGVWSRHDLLTEHERLLRLEKATAERKVELTAEQAKLLERFSPELRERHIEAPPTGALVAVATFFVGHRKGVGKVYLRTAVDCHSRHARAKLSTDKLPLTAVRTLGNGVLPPFEAHGAVIEAVLSDHGRASRGRPDQHPYELFLRLEGIEHKTTRVGRPRSNGIAERLHRTLLDQHPRVQGRTVWHETVEEMQKARDAGLLRYNRERPHQGRGMNGRSPLQAFLDGLPKEKETMPEPLAARTQPTREERRLSGLLRRCPLPGRSGYQMKPDCSTSDGTS